MAVLTELRNRGVVDVCIVACDGLKGLPEAIGEVWPLATVQGCVVHLIRDTLRYASKVHWSAIAKSLRTIYTAPTAEAAETRFAEFTHEDPDSPLRDTERRAKCDVASYGAGAAGVPMCPWGIRPRGTSGWRGNSLGVDDYLSR